MRPIGGFFPLRLPGRRNESDSILSTWVASGDDAWFVHNARSALLALWECTEPRRIWLPAYICGELVSAVPMRIPVRFYPLDKMLHPDADFLRANVSQGDHVLAVDYFGRPPRDDFIDLVAAHQQVGWIEDRAQALAPGAESWGDWLLFSPRKLLGVPDGGILVGRRKPLPAAEFVPLPDMAFIRPSLERFEDADEVDNDAWYQSYISAEKAFKPGNLRMSRITHSILNGLDINHDIETRRQNYSTLRGRLPALAFLPDTHPTFAPFGFPVRVPCAATLAKRLAGKRVFAARHWAALPSDSSMFVSEHQLAREVLTLPCDYRYGSDDMHWIADTVLASAPLDMPAR